MARRTRDSVDKRVADRVRSLREEQGISQAELARQAKIARSHLSQIESGNNVPSVVTADALARALGVPITQLVAEEEQPVRPDPADGIAVLLRERGPAYLAAVKTYIRTLDKIAKDLKRQG